MEQARKVPEGKDAEMARADREAVRGLAEAKVAAWGKAKAWAATATAKASALQPSPLPQEQKA